MTIVWLNVMIEECGKVNWWDGLDSGVCTEVKRI